MNQKSINALLSQAEDDWLSYAEVLLILRENQSDVNLDADVDSIITENILTAGDLLENKGFVPWNGSSAILIAELHRRKLGLEKYYPGDVCWLALPSGVSSHL